MSSSELPRSVWKAIPGYAFLSLWPLITLLADWMLISATWAQSRSTSFLQTAGQVLHSGVRYDDEVSVPVVKFAYRVGGADYIGTRYRLAGGISGNGIAERIVADLPPGKAVDVYYNPHNPAEAVLFTGIGGDDLIAPFLLIPFNLVPLFVVIGLRDSRKFAATAGARLDDDGVVARVTLTHWLPIQRALVTAAIVSIVLFFALCFAFDVRPSQTIALIAWIVLLGAAGASYWWTSRFLGTGARDLVVDRARGTVTIPPLHGRTCAITLPWSAIAGVEVDELPSNNEILRYSSMVIVMSSDSSISRERFTPKWYKPNAETLAQWLMNQLHLSDSAKPKTG